MRGKIILIFAIMPVFYQHAINETTRVGIWQITEPEAFFLEKVPLQRTITHPHKRLQHLAGRYLLRELFDDFPIEAIAIADTRKPFLENEAYHFSISHCGNYAAALVSSTQRVGVDVELITPKIEKVGHKFLCKTEWEIAALAFMQEGEFSITRNRMLTFIWSCKEAVFKWYGYGEVDFIKHIQLQHVRVNKSDANTIIAFLFTKLATPVVLELKVQEWNGLVMAWLCTKI
jgi:phosphopantetheinyl transferase